MMLAKDRYYARSMNIIAYVSQDNNYEIDPAKREEIGNIRFTYYVLDGHNYYQVTGAHNILQATSAIEHQKLGENKPTTTSPPPTPGHVSNGQKAIKVEKITTKYFEALRGDARLITLNANSGNKNILKKHSMPSSRRGKFPKRSSQSGKI